MSDSVLPDIAPVQDEVEGDGLPEGVDLAALAQIEIDPDLTKPGEAAPEASKPIDFRMGEEA